MKKQEKKADDTQMENEIQEDAELETAPLPDDVSEQDKNGDLEAEVTDITDTILPFLISEEELDQLRQELDEARKLADENLDGWQRARAEFSNYKKRIERERKEERARIVGEILTQYLCILDDLDRALRERPEDPDAASWADGIDLIYRKMQSILEYEKVEVIPAEGEIFDPNIHEAIAQEESEDHDEGEIVEVVQQGYKIGDRILRPAIVRIAK